MQPLKDVYSPAFFEALAAAIALSLPSFDTREFQQRIHDEHWQYKALKARMRHISESLHACLTDNVANNLGILQAANTELHQHYQMQGFVGMFFPDYVARFARDDFKLAMPALAFFTAYSSAEFAIRPFILRYPDAAMQQMLVWAKDDNAHIRRLASEGCRPRLPWAMQLPDFITDPSPILPILSLLKHDSSAYVRRSVANNLNDIAKDHPDLVYQLSQQWLGQSADTDQLIQHACRTLLKTAHPQTLALLGYAPARHIQLTDFKHTALVIWQGELQFSFALRSQAALGKVRLEFAISFVSKHGQRIRCKVFKISAFESADKRKDFCKKFSFRPISTRNYYPGKHGLDIILNGQTVASGDFILQPPLL